MTEQPETAEFRRWYASGWRGGKEIPELIQVDALDLLRALDAARAERDRQARNTIEALAESDEYGAELDRTVVQLEKTMERESAAVKRAEAAEARIAKALDRYHEWFGDDYEGPSTAAQMARALTGNTE